MNGYIADIEELTEANESFRRVLFTTHHLQLVLMALKPGEAIGRETHAARDQFFRVETGKGEIEIDGQLHQIKGGSGIVVPAGSTHNLTNTGNKILQLYTLYGPPEHLDQLVQVSKAEAVASHEAFDGIVSH